MQKLELIRELTQGRLDFMELVEDLDDAVVQEPGVIGEWSVRDILAHVSRREADLLPLLYQIQQGRNPVNQARRMEVDERNAHWHNETQGRRLDRVLSDFHTVRRQTIRRVEALPERDLNDPKRYVWLKGLSLSERIAAESVEHEAEHGAQIRVWRKRRGL